MTITFYTSDNIPTQNLYHEFGHLLDNGLHDAITNELRGGAVYYEGEYLFGGSGLGNISENTINNRRLHDLYRTNLVDAMQHPSTDPNEQWADLFANLISDNIAVNAQGDKVWEWLFNHVIPILGNGY
jgi:hypothetical protein